MPKTLRDVAQPTVPMGKAPAPAEPTVTPNLPQTPPPAPGAGAPNIQSPQQPAPDKSQLQDTGAQSPGPSMPGQGFWDKVRGAIGTGVRQYAQAVQQEPHGVDPGGFKAEQLAQSRQFGEERWDIERQKTTALQSKASAAIAVSEGALAKQNMVMVRDTQGNPVGSRMMTDEEQLARAGPGGRAKMEYDKAHAAYQDALAAGHPEEIRIKREEADNKRLALENTLRHQGVTESQGAQRIAIAQTNLEAGTRVDPETGMKYKVGAGVVEKALSARVTQATIGDAQDKLKDPNFRAKLGPIMGRINEVFAGTIGAGDPDFAEFRTMGSLIASGALKAHFGAKGAGAIYDKFVGLINTGKMTPETLSASLGEMNKVMGRYSQEVFDPARKLGAAKPTSPPGSAGPLQPGGPAAPGAKKKAYQKEGKWYDATTHQPI